MAFDPNMNMLGTSMTHESNIELPGWCQNEESVDLANFMSSSHNLELCEDELFEVLFPPNSPNTSASHVDKTDKEVEKWSHHSHADTTASACSSTTTSPVQQTYYHTPPVTPRTEPLRVASPHHLQFESLTASMSSTGLASLRSSDARLSKQVSTSNFHVTNKNPTSNVHSINQALDSKHYSSNLAPTTSLLPNRDPVLNSQLPNQNSFVSETFSKFDPHTRVKQEVDRRSFVPFAVSTNFSPPHSRADANPRIPTDQTASSAQESGAAGKRSRVSPYQLDVKKSKFPDKGSAEYFEKRKRNNVAVRRSRDKAKLKAMETQRRVSELTNENTALRRRVAELSHELNTLKNLLTTLPHNTFPNM